MKYIMIVSAFWIFSSCANEVSNDNKQISSSNQTEQEDTEIENFDHFFSKFSSDSTFQVSRIVFPIAVERYDIDKGSFDYSKMDRTEWGFYNIKELGNEYITAINKTDSTNVFTLQLSETGVYVEYLFIIQNNKWMMVKIIDQST